MQHKSTIRHLFLLIITCLLLSPDPVAQTENTSMANNQLVRDYKESQLLFQENDFDQLPERLLKKRLDRFKISKLS